MKDEILTILVFSWVLVLLAVWLIYSFYIIANFKNEELEVEEKTSGFKRFWLYLLCKIKLKSNGQPEQPKGQD